MQAHLEGSCHVVLDGTRNAVCDGSIVVMTGGNLGGTLSMSSDIARGARAFGVHGSFELRAFFEGKMPSDDVRLNGRCRSDVDTVGGDVSLEIPIDGHFAGGDGGADARPGAGDKTMT